MLVFFLAVLTGAASASVSFQGTHDDAESLVQVHSMQSPEPPLKYGKDHDETTDIEIDAGLGWHPDYWEDDPNFVEKPYHRPDYRRVPEEYVLLYPAKKLAFCFIPKVACTQFNVLFNKLNGRPYRQENPWSHAPYGVSSMPGFGHDFAHTTRAKGWKWAVFLRDPLLRYLSAWGSKCVQRESDDCVPSTMYSEGDVADFEENVKRNHQHPEQLAENAHWASQSDICRGANRSYDFIGHLRGNVTDQVLNMFKMVGAKGSHIERYVKEAFPINRVAGHHSSLDPYKYYRHVSTKRAVKEMYSKDFHLPGVL